MYQKNLLRKHYLNSRKQKYFEVDQSFFLSLIDYVKNNLQKKKLNLALYYPSNFEFEFIKMLDNNLILNQHKFIPVIEDDKK